MASSRSPYRLREPLGLDAYETLATAHSVQTYFGYALVGVLVMLVALLLPTRLAGIAGALFFFNFVVSWVLGASFRRRAKRILAQRAAPAAATPAGKS